MVAEREREKEIRKEGGKQIEKTSCFKRAKGKEKIMEKARRVNEKEKEKRNRRRERTTHGNKHE